VLLHNEFGKSCSEKRPAPVRRAETEVCQLCNGRGQADSGLIHSSDELDGFDKLNGELDVEHKAGERRQI
jgi:hypothetical protein